MVMFQPQQKITRPMGNAQARNTPLGAAPAFGNTTNVNGAQTAVSGSGSYPGNILGLPKQLNKTDTIVNSNTALQDMMPSLPPASSSPPAIQPQYPGGDVAGLATYYRNTAQQNYNPQAIEAQTREANRNAQYMGAEPVAGSSLASAQINARRPADLLNPVTARVGNAYDGMVGFANDPNRLTPNQKAGLARESALRTVGGGAAADPTGLGARFGGALGQQATSDSDAIRSGQAVRLADGTVSRFTGTLESARAAQLKGKAERESLRDRSNMNVPQEELDRRKAADAQKAARSNRARAFEAENDGLTYKHMDRLERKFILKQKAVREGRKSQSQADAEMGFERDKMVRRRSGMTGIPGERPPLPLREMKQGGNLKTQPPDVAAKAVETMVTHSPILKSMGVTPDTDLSTLHTSVASMDLSQMTSTQKFEAARHLHEFMLSQMESGNPAYQLGEGAGQDGSDPRVSLIGLDGVKPGNKAQMIQWLEDLHRQASGARPSPPKGTSPLAPLTPREMPMGITPPRAGNPF